MLDQLRLDHTLSAQLSALKDLTDPLSMARCSALATELKSVQHKITAAKPAPGRVKVLDGVVTSAQNRLSKAEADLKGAAEAVRKAVDAHKSCQRRIHEEQLALQAAKAQLAAAKADQLQEEASTRASNVDLAFSSLSALLDSPDATENEKADIENMLQASCLRSLRERMRSPARQDFATPTGNSSMRDGRQDVRMTPASWDPYGTGSAMNITHLGNSGLAAGAAIQGTGRTAGTPAPADTETSSNALPVREVNKLPADHFADDWESDNLQYPTMAIIGDDFVATGGT